MARYAILNAIQSAKLALLDELAILETVKEDKANQILQCAIDELLELLKEAKLANELESSFEPAEWLGESDGEQGPNCA
jgi:hypothetical protein